MSDRIKRTAIYGCKVMVGVIVLALTLVNVAISLLSAKFR